MDRLLDWLASIAPLALVGPASVKVSGQPVRLAICSWTVACASPVGLDVAVATPVFVAVAVLVAVPVEVAVGGTAPHKLNGDEEFLGLLGFNN